MFFISAVPDFAKAVEKYCPANALRAAPLFSPALSRRRGSTLWRLWSQFRIKSVRSLRPSSRKATARPFRVCHIGTRHRSVHRTPYTEQSTVNGRNDALHGRVFPVRDRLAGLLRCPYGAPLADDQSD